jgi:hypothetical protein
MALSGIKVSGGTLFHTMEYLKERYGKDRVDQILARLSPEAQKTAKVALVSSKYSVEYLGELLDGIKATLGDRDPDINWTVGHEGFKAAFSLLYKVVVKVGGPKIIISRANQVWRQFATEGDLEPSEQTEKSATFRLQNFRYVNPELCSKRFLGGFQALLELAGCKITHASHPRCTAKGDPCCEWRYEWS